MSTFRAIHESDWCAPTGMRWSLSHRYDRAALPLADRHYNRRKVGSPQFVPPGRCLVLLTGGADALWVTSWPFAEYVKHDWAGAWVNSLFRNEGPYLSSELIREAAAATRARWGDPPALGMVTFVDATKTRKKRDPGRCDGGEEATIRDVTDLGASDTRHWRYAISVEFKDGRTNLYSELDFE